MYGIVCILCALKSDLIRTDNENAIKDTLNIIKMFITPINAIIILTPIGNIVGKVYDEVITTKVATRRIAIFLVIFILALLFEASYIGSFINNLLG